MTAGTDPGAHRFAQLTRLGLTTNVQYLDHASVRMVVVAHLDFPLPVEYWAYADPTAEGFAVVADRGLQVIPRGGTVISDWTGLPRTPTQIQQTFPGCLVVERWMGVDE